MKHIALYAGLALAIAAPAFAQDAAQEATQEAPQNAPVSNMPTGDTPAAATTSTHHSTTTYHGPHKYPMHTRGRAGDPKIVDHSADTLVVEPTHTTVTVPPKPPK